MGRITLTLALSREQERGGLTAEGGMGGIQCGASWL